jgi:lipopolysaccharide transport system permease protein
MAALDGQFRAMDDQEPEMVSRRPALSRVGYEEIRSKGQRMAEALVAANAECKPEEIAARLPESARTVIQPTTGWIRLNLGDLWRYRELLFFLVWRDIKVRYKQTVLGAMWAILQPFLNMLVFTVVFGRLARVPSDGIPYALFTYTALIPWQLFAYALTESSSSVVLNERLITKIYFPRLVIPISSVLAGLVDFIVALPVVAAMMLWYHRTLSWAAFTLPFFVIFALATALGVGLWLAALNVQYRDVRYTLAFIVQFWLFASPVAYSSTLIPAKWRPWYGLNPMAGVIQGFRWALLGAPAPGAMLAVSIGVVFIVLMGGLYYFRRMERTFADVV